MVHNIQAGPHDESDHENVSRVSECFNESSASGQWRHRTFGLVCYPMASDRIIVLHTNLIDAPVQVPKS